MASRTVPGPIIECPTCGSEVWDNTQDKRNPKAPDYKCKNDSDHAFWLPKGQSPPRQAAVVTSSGGKATWKSIYQAYATSIDVAAKAWGPKWQTMSDVAQASCVATVLIQGAKEGLTRSAAPAPKPKPVPQPSYDEVPKALADDSDDNLPF